MVLIFRMRESEGDGEITISVGPLADSAKNIIGVESSTGKLLLSSKEGDRVTFSGTGYIIESITQG